MSRSLFARGLKGATATHIQKDLFRLGFTTLPIEKFADGDFGGLTETAVRTLQTQRQLPATGTVDTDTWGAAHARPRCRASSRAVST